MRAKATFGVVICGSTLAAVLACSSEETRSDGAAGSSSPAGGTSGGSHANGGRGGAVSPNAGASELEGGATAESAGGGGGTANAGAAGNDSALAGQANSAGAGGVADCDGSLLILLDHSKSMMEYELTPGLNQWVAVQTALSTVIDALPTPRPWALKLFPDGPDGPECAVSSSEMTIPFAASSSSAVRDSVLTTTALGNGTPLPAAYEVALKYLNALPQRATSILVITDGIPNCSLAGMPVSDTAQTEAVQFAKDAAQEGFRSYVVGVGATSSTDASALAELAQAGETTLLSNPVSPEFYAGADQAQLIASLTSVVERVARCSTGPAIEQPGYHALPFAADFENGSLDDFRLSGESSVETSGSSAIVSDGANHLLSIDASTDATLAVAGGHEWTDVALHVKVRLADENAAAALRLRFDLQSRSSIMLNLGVGLFRVRQRGQGFTTDLINPNPKPVILADTWYDVAFSVVGDQVSASLDGVVIGSATIADTAPRGGLALGSLGGGVEYDDLSVTVP